MRKVMFFWMVMASVLCAGNVHAFKRGMEKANPVFEDRGANVDRAAVAIGTTTPVAILSTTTYPAGLRVVEVCNPTAFQLFVGTITTVSGSTLTVVNAREVVLANTCKDVGFQQPLYAIFESASGAVSKIITTVIRYQLGD